MYSPYSHPNFDLKQKFQQYGPCFKTIFPFLMTMIQNTMSDGNTLMLLQYSINPIQDGPFWGCSRMGRAKKAPLSKICHKYPTIMKLDTVIPYLKKTQKIYESRDTPLEFC